MRYIDPIHGVMDLPNIIFEIINTEFFQRLRNLKQLGACSYVFPGATHSRFEHCIGWGLCSGCCFVFLYLTLSLKPTGCFSVCHLIDKFLDILEKNSAIKVTDYHRKCVMIAGLLHDVGHGPFSHMWDQFVHQCKYKDWNVSWNFHNLNLTWRLRYKKVVGAAQSLDQHRSSFHFGFYILWVISNSNWFSLCVSLPARNFVLWYSATHFR